MAGHQEPSSARVRRARCERAAVAVEIGFATRPELLDAVARTARAGVRSVGGGDDVHGADRAPRVDFEGHWLRFMVAIGGDREPSARHHFRSGCCGPGGG